MLGSHDAISLGRLALFGHRSFRIGKRQRLDFKSVRLIRHQFQPRSRLVVVLSVVKQPDQQINYGTGQEVSDESIADAKEPLAIQWYSDSFVDVPIRE